MGIDYRGADIFVPQQFLHSLRYLVATLDTRAWINGVLDSDKSSSMGYKYA